MKKKIVVDIDGTICTQEKNYEDAKPIYDRIKVFNQFFNEGNEVIYFTARGTETGIDWRSITEKQFKEWNVKYSKLIFGKPSADYYFDDRSFSLKKLDYQIEKGGKVCL